MQKETLTLSGITQDLRLIASQQYTLQTERYSYILAIIALAILAAIFTKIWIGIAILCCAIYPCLCFAKECRAYRAKSDALASVIMRGDVSVSIKAFSHTAIQEIYEPHSSGRHRHATRSVMFFYFSAGSSWRVPVVSKHYAWSKEHYISTQGLENISLVGDEFFYVSLQGYPDISYIYPCKTFVLDSSLKVVD